MNEAVFKLLCPFQLRWLRENAPLAGGEKSRRIGWTWMHALGAVLGRAGKRKTCNYYHSSTDQTASVEFIDYCGEWARMVNAVAVVAEEKEVIDEQEITSLVMKFQNGSKIVAGSSNPKFFRSKGGEVGLDEYAFARDGRELYKAAHATAMFWGYPLRFWSTHNGPTSYFNQLITQIRNGQMKGVVHRVTILDAVADGIVERIEMRRKRLDYIPDPDESARRAWLDELRATCPDQDTWDQEYMCVPSTDQGSLLNYELIQGCEVANLELWDGVDGVAESRALYAGFDVGRKHDLSVLWILERVGDVFWTRVLKTLKNTTFSAQEGLIDQVMSNRAVRRMCIDSSGLGMDMAERLKQRWGAHRLEPVNFTAPVKADLALPLLQLFQDRRARVPAEAEVREDLHKIRRVITTSGNVRFEAERSESGHADRFWSLALAHHAADMRNVPLPAPLLYKPGGW